MANRRTFTADFKTKVALDALQGDQTVQQLASKFKIPAAQVSSFKQQGIENMKQGFASPKAKSKEPPEREVKELHAKIGQLTMERDFLADGLKLVGIKSGKR